MQNYRRAPSVGHRGYNTENGETGFSVRKRVLLGPDWKPQVFAEHRVVGKVGFALLPAAHGNEGSQTSACRGEIDDPLDLAPESETSDPKRDTFPNRLLYCSFQTSSLSSRSLRPDTSVCFSSSFLIHLPPPPRARRLAAPRRTTHKAPSIVPHSSWIEPIWTISKTPVSPLKRKSLLERAHLCSSSPRCRVKTAFPDRKS